MRGYMCTYITYIRIACSTLYVNFIIYYLYTYNVFWLVFLTYICCGVQLQRIYRGNMAPIFTTIYRATI